MYKDIISYKLAAGISQKHLLNIAAKISKIWMSHQKGFIKWEIHKNNEGHYTDIVYWKSEQDKKKSESNMINSPNANDWFACYDKNSITSQKLSEIGKFNA